MTTLVTVHRFTLPRFIAPRLPRPRLHVAARRVAAGGVFGVAGVGRAHVAAIPPVAPAALTRFAGPAVDVDHLLELDRRLVGDERGVDGGPARLGGAALRGGRRFQSCDLLLLGHERTSCVNADWSKRGAVAGGGKCGDRTGRRFSRVEKLKWT